MSKKDMTNRIIKAMENEHVDIIAHPTGRVIGQRNTYDLDLDEIFEKAKQTKTILEIDCYPNRMDLNYENVKRAVKSGVKLSIGTDSHAITEMGAWNKILESYIL